MHVPCERLGLMFLGGSLSRGGTGGTFFFFADGGRERGLRYVDISTDRFHPICKPIIMQCLENSAFNILGKVACKQNIVLIQSSSSDACWTQGGPKNKRCTALTSTSAKTRHSSRPRGAMHSWEFVLFSKKDHDVFHGHSLVSLGSLFR